VVFCVWGSKGVVAIIIFIIGYNWSMTRRKSKKVNIIFIILMLIALGYLYFKFSPSQTNDKTDKTEQSDGKNFPINLKINKKSLNSNPEWYKEITAEYPEGDVAGVANIEKVVREEVAQLWCANDDEKLTEIEAKQKGMLEMYKCSLDIKYSFANNKKLISHKLGEYGTYGGTHGIYVSKTFTYDTNGKQLVLSDLFYDTDTYKKILSEKLKISFKQIQKQNKDYNFDPILDDITSESVIESVPFIIKPESITFLFSEMHGVAYGLGEVEVAIPFVDLQGVMKSEYID
jgi:hypothetical protein